MGMARLGFILFSLVLLTGCIGIDRPKVSVQSVRLDEQTPTGGRVLVDLLVTNPNNEELPMPRVSYSVDVVGAGSFEFTDRPYAAAPREGEVTLTLAAAVTGSNLRGKAVAVDGVLIFEPDGELRRVLYDNYVPLPRSRFSAQGVLE